MKPEIGLPMDYLLVPLGLVAVAVAAWLGARHSMRRGASPQRSSPQPRILIVDDDVQVRSMLARLVRSLGYLAVTASDGEEALLLLKKDGADVIVLDLNMAGMDGVTFREVQRLTPGIALIPVIVLTGRAPTPAQVHALGDVTVIQKPFATSEIQAALSLYLGEPHVGS